MGVIRLESVSRQFAGQVIFSDLSLELHSGQTTALVGANGSGKTTLFRLITGEVPIESGSVSHSRDVEIGYLPQEPTFESATTLKEAVGAAFAELLDMEHRLAELSHRIAELHEAPEAEQLMRQYDRLHARFEAAGGYTFEQRLSEVLGGLGFSPRDYDLPVAALSGGQKCRAALARLLLQDATFLLLDEPTNHLDIDAVHWLELFLKSHSGGAAIISHDRYLLDRLAERTIELVPGRGGARAVSYTGNYSAFVEQRETQRLTEARRYEQDQAFIARERGYIARYKAGQRARQAQGRLKRLERQIGSGELATGRESQQRRSASIHFGAASPRSRTQTAVVEVRGLAKAYGDKRLFESLDLDVWTGQRLGITGPNGTGKSTLLKILVGQVVADAGTARVAPTAKVGYFAQDALELDPGRTIIEEIQAVRGDFLERDARQYAARFLFVDDDPFKRVAVLSGGEQSRVRLMKLILSAPDLLILDEPTNHLDIASREALEGALDEFEGTIIAVSHDRYFLDRVIDRLLVIRPEGWRLFPGNYSEYIETADRERAAAQAAADAARVEARRKAHAAARSAVRGSDARAAASGGVAPRRPASRYAKLSLEALEALIHDHTARLAALQQRFGDPEIYKDPAALSQLQGELAAVQAELDEAEAAWIERAE